MKRLFFMLLSLFFIYFSVQYIYYFFGEGHQVTYQINTDNKTYVISEISVKNTKNERDNYYFEIKDENRSYTFQIFKGFAKGKKVIEDIVTVEKDNYSCILPLFEKNKVLFDFLCFKDNVLYYYSSIKGKSNNLDTAIAELSTDLYNPDQFVSDDSVSENLENVTLYKKNLVEGHYMVVNEYKGIIQVYSDYTRGMKFVKLFDKDVYNPKLVATVGKYYVISDYDSEHSFNKFNIVNILDGSNKVLSVNYKISFDSYVQGVIGGNIYLLDRDNSVQYEIDAQKGTINQTFTPHTFFKYYDGGKWENINIDAAVVKDYIFKNETDEVTTEGYDKTIKVGGEKSGYIYMLKKNGKRYDVYRANVQNQNIITYLFTTDNLDRVRFVDEYVYYSLDNDVYVYADHMASRKVFTHKEFEFNKNLTYYVISKK